MGRSDLRGKAQFRRYWEIRFFTTLQCWQFFLNEGQLRPPIARPKHLLPQFGTHILNRLDMRIHQVPFCHPTFGWFLVISEVGIRIYKVKSLILIFLVFLLICLYEITLYAIYIDNIGCLEPFYYSRTTSKFGGFWDWNLRLILQCVV